ncbi:hypothetical protein QYE76_010994 [Lolium multiflorum]|uniref:Reverse transcriptase domain-containing protein n=1 Tax=Lolium multiflorum TaxID=4521 RepID=A0AAD8TWL8_LOLMU|nr:hypothetical protein QYE76_010994 [Lolium multiflorum]
MAALLALKHRGTVDEYCTTFQELVFKLSGHNPYYDETFFVEQFLKGLKTEVRVPVASQVPQTLDRAMLLEHVQQDLSNQTKPWANKNYGGGRQEAAPIRGEPARAVPILGTGDLWKERQLREYRRSNNLCFRCGDKYDPTHVCAKQQQAGVHALTVEEHAAELTPEVLNLLELQDIAEAQQFSLSLHALTGTENPDTVRLRALVQNQVLLILVDTGSSHSFLSSRFAERIDCELTDIPAVSVRVANDEWSKGNDVWAMVVIEECTEEKVASVPNEIQSVLKQYTDVFSEPQTLPPQREYDHAIPLVPGAAPVNARPYRYSPLHKDEIERQVNAMLQDGLIVPSMSPFASPVLLVQKKDGTWRFCIDYRRLNEITIRNTFPMPVIDELLDELAGSKLFSKLDLHAGYHQIRMRAGDEEKTAFKTHHGHYQFRVMPFGLSNAPATFQCVMNSVLQPCLRKFVLVFMDDILVYSPSLPEHALHLSTMLKLLQQHKLFVKKSKCSFAQAQLEYLGHIVSAEGVAIDPKKTAAMVAWPRPTTVTELRGFLGLTGYYRKFVRAYGILAKPLTNLLKKKAFVWSAEAEEAFLALKKAMSTTPVLTLPDFSKQFVVETDACDSGVGAVLMQDSHPVAFLSKALSVHHRSLSIYENEFLALIMAVERWRSYLQRGEFIIKTDHQSLTFLADQTLHSPMQRKAMARLMGLQFRIKYKKGIENTAADSLSRVADVIHLHAVSEARPAWIQEVLNSYVTDSEAQAKIQELAVTSPNEQGYSLQNGLIKFHERVWIVNNTALQTKLISAFHSSAIGGHSGIFPTYQRLKRMFAWNGMKLAIENFEHLARLKEYLAAAQLRMKLQADKHKMEKEYQVGDEVLLKLQPYSQSSLVNRPYPKLAFKFFGPYKILERIGSVAYKLDLPDSCGIHPVFHVSQLKTFVPDYSPVFSTLPSFPELDTGDPEPESILERRLVKKGNTAIPQGLINWKGIAADAATWEDINVLKVRFPALLLGDKQALVGRQV